jgi:hypothetical protein
LTPVDRVAAADARQRQDPVRHAAVAGEEHREQQSGGGHRGDVRQQHADPPPGGRPQPAVQQVGDDQREQQLRHRGQQEDAERVDQRVPEVVVGEQPLEVGEAGPAGQRRIVQPPVPERHDPVEHDREQPEGVRLVSK